MLNQINLTGTLPNSLALPTQTLGYPSGSNWCFAASGSSGVAYAIDPANEKITFTGVASTTAIYLLQRIESKDIVTLANKLAAVTFSFETSNSLLTSVNWRIARPSTTADTHGTIASPTQTTIASGTVTVNSTLTRYSVTAILPIEAALGAQIELSVGAQTSGTWVMSQMQLEEGSVATDFNCDDYPSELIKCKRYYQDLGAYGLLFSGDITSGQSYSVKQDFLEMRDAPQGVLVASSAAGFNNTLGSFIVGKDYIIETRTAIATGTGAWVDTATLSAHIP